MRLAAVFLILAASLLAQSKPDFSGDWKMNLEKSDFGPFPSPQSLARKIDHKEPNLHLVTKQSGQRGEVTTELRYTTDGKECTNIVAGAEVKGTARWDGESLLIDSRRSTQAGEFAFREKWSLQDGGKTLTIATHVVAPMGETDIRVVLEKQ